METIKNYENLQKVEENQKINKNTEQYKNSVSNTLNYNATKELVEIFGLNKEQISKLTNNETERLSNENEVNSMEAQLAKMFGKYDEMIELSNQPISLASVMHEYDEYEKRVAA
ncbi:hypothetical protein LRZ95_01465 [Candidatus Gracilibacteria bacterium]|nr:hypothetical protein [Candidatus Gracilibacteria bacterium]